MNRPIGVFDSGLGGLTVMAAIRALLPGEHIVYFGDTARVPYGSKSQEVVTGYARQIAAFLLSCNVKMIVIACNTASAYALNALRGELPVPVVGVIEPGARSAAAGGRARRIGVIGTEGTIRSLSYAKAIKRIDPRATVIAQSCPLFVPLVEEGWTDHPVTRQVAGIYLQPLMKKRIDTLVLGCTHYPLLTPLLRRVAGPSVRLVDSAEATAAEVAAILARDGIAAAGRRQGSSVFYASDAPAKFQALGERFLGRSIAPVKKIVL